MGSLRKRIAKFVVFPYIAILVLFLFYRTVSAVTIYDCDNNVHQYNVTIEKQAGESEDGLRKYECQLCGHSYEEAIPMYGHEFGEWEVETEPACTEEGLQFRICIKHDHVEPVREEEAIPATGEHEYEEATTETDCTEPGQILYVCTVCGDEYNEDIPPLGHEYGEWIVDKEPTSSEEGHRYRVCIHDESHIEEEAIKKTTAVNTADVVLGTANVSAVWIFGIKIGQDMMVLRWHRRKIRQLMKKGFHVRRR